VLREQRQKKAARELHLRQVLVFKASRLSRFFSGPPLRFSRSLSPRCREAWVSRGLPQNRDRAWRRGRKVHVPCGVAESLQHEARGVIGVLTSQCLSTSRCVMDQLLRREGVRTRYAARAPSIIAFLTSGGRAEKGGRSGKWASAADGSEAPVRERSLNIADDKSSIFFDSSTSSM
jgi:hypothetical protein